MITLCFVGGSYLLGAVIGVVGIAAAVVLLRFTAIDENLAITIVLGLMLVLGLALDVFR